MTVKKAHCMISGQSCLGGSWFRRGQRVLPTGRCTRPSKRDRRAGVEGRAWRDCGCCKAARESGPTQPHFGFSGTLPAPTRQREFVKKPIDPVKITLNCSMALGDEGSPSPAEEGEPPQAEERQKRERQPTNFFIKSSKTPAKEASSASPTKKRRARPPPKPERERTDTNGTDGSAGEEEGAADNGKRKRKKKTMSYVVPGSDEDSPDSHVIPRKDDIEARIATGDACTLCRRCVSCQPRHRIGSPCFDNAAHTLKSGVECDSCEARPWNPSVTVSFYSVP